MASLHTVLKQNFPKENKLPANREGCGPSLKVRSAECEAHTHTVCRVALVEALYRTCTIC